ncbi:MAG: hypothetical protein WDN06_02710 [Asticcacaulis sp.]
MHDSAIKLLENLRQDKRFSELAERALGLVKNSPEIAYSLSPNEINSRQIADIYAIRRRNAKYDAKLLRGVDETIEVFSGDSQILRQHAFRAENLSLVIWQSATNHRALAMILGSPNDESI